jgi:esterase/lipase superfamily enzyme
VNKAFEIAFRKGRLLGFLVIGLYGCSSSPEPKTPPRTSRNGEATTAVYASAAISLDPDYVVIPVYYATDRKPLLPLTEWKEKLRDRGSEFEYYGPDFDNELQLGVCPVSIPTRVHVSGNIERPRWYESESLEKHFFIITLTTLSSNDFVRRIDAQLTKTKRLDAFVFVHGYNVRFSAAAMRTAQLAYDWGFEGVPILYSWPSDGTILRYDKDQETAQLTRGHFRHFLKNVVASTQATNIHIIAHSMGNRVVTDVLKEFLTETNQPVFKEVVLAAPDVNRIGFINDIAPLIPKVARRISLYASSEDNALRIANLKSTYPRAGQAGEHLVLAKGIETIDASGVDTDMLGHSYLANAQNVIEDLADVLCRSVPASGRRLERRNDGSGGEYWKIK